MSLRTVTNHHMKKTVVTTVRAKPVWGGGAEGWLMFGCGNENSV